LVTADSAAMGSGLLTTTPWHSGAAGCTSNVALSGQMSFV
jgi:hypothetical protein